MPDQIEREEKTLLVSLYDGCQYFCTFCMYGYVKETQPLSKKETMSEEDWYDLFTAAYARGYRDMEIGGRGEPTLHPAFTRIVAKAYDMGYNIELLTNGLNDKAVISVLPFIRKIKINLNGIDEQEVSKIHQPSPGISFDRCITSVKNIIRTIVEKDFKIKTRTNYVVTTQSLNEAFTFPERVNRLLAAELSTRKLFIIYRHFHSYVKTTPADYLGFDYEGLQRVLLLSRENRRQRFLLENTNLMEFIAKTEKLIERLKPFSEKPSGEASHCSKHTHYTCEAHKRILFIDGNGDCYGCYNPFRAVNGLPIEQDPFFFGNLLLQSSEEIFAKEKGFKPVMDVTKIYWRTCLFCQAKGPVTAGAA